MQDVFSFLSREIIGGKTLFPKIMAKIGFIPTYVTPAISITPSGSVASVTPVYVTPVEDHRVQKRLALEMRKDSHVRGLYEQVWGSYGCNYSKFSSITLFSVLSSTELIQSLISWESRPAYSIPWKSCSINWKRPPTSWLTCCIFSVWKTMPKSS